MFGWELKQKHGEIVLMQLLPLYAKQTQQSEEGIADFRRTKTSCKCHRMSLTPKPAQDKTRLYHHRNSTIAHQVFVWLQEGSLAGEDTLNDKRKTKMCCNILLNTWRNCSSKQHCITVECQCDLDVRISPKTDLQKKKKKQDQGFCFFKFDAILTSLAESVGHLPRYQTPWREKMRKLPSCLSVSVYINGSLNN